MIDENFSPDPITEEQAKANFIAEWKNEVRAERNRLLADTDYFALSDVTLADNMKTYRQQLRDLTSGLDTVDKVNNVTWPTKPS